MNNYLDQTEKYVLPMAMDVNRNMAIELVDLTAKRKKQMNLLSYPGLLKF
jgi:hypothetical protein